MRLLNTTKYPLVDGQEIESLRGGKETVWGEIKPEHEEPICWTLQGNWYRRSDGEEMTGCNGKVMTTKEFYEK